MPGAPASAFARRVAARALPCDLINARSGVTIARAIELALDRRSRRIGLLGRSTLARSSALVLAPCRTVHTCFMRFAIDLVFVESNGHVLKLCPEFGPWRAAAAWGAFAAIELPRTTIALADIRLHDRLELLPRALPV